MFGSIIFFTALPVLVFCSGEGNIHLLEYEVAAAMKSCDPPTNESYKENGNGERQRRSEDINRYDDRGRIDSDIRSGVNQYNHERRNSSNAGDQIHVLNATDYDYGGYGTGSNGKKLINTIPKHTSGINETNAIRAKRSEQLLNKPDVDQCFNQCVFANLQVVDSRGIPREPELWNKIQSVVTSQQSRAALRDQIRACFQELQTEAEDNGCAYSNKLERCLMLRFSDRKINIKKENKT